MIKTNNCVYQMVFIGVGGCGMNMLEYMSGQMPENARSIGVNRDAERLRGETDIQHRIFLDEIFATDERGDLLPVGKDEVQKTMQQHWPELEVLLCDTDSVCLLAGLGGATGSWASQVIVQELKMMRKQISMVAVEPFDCERRRMRIASQAQDAFGSVDYLVVAPNQQLMDWSKPGDSMDEAFARMNKLIYEAWSLIEQGGLKAGHYRIAARDDQINEAWHLATEGFALNRIPA